MAEEKEVPKYNINDLATALGIAPASKLDKFVQFLDIYCLVTGYHLKPDHTGIILTPDLCVQ